MFDRSAESAIGGPAAPWFLLPAFLGAAIGALVVLYVLRLRRSYPHAFAVEPPLAKVAPDPELVRVVAATAGSTEGFTVLFVVHIPVINKCRPRVLCLPIICSLHNKVRFQFVEPQKANSWILF